MSLQLARVALACVILSLVAGSIWAWIAILSRIGRGQPLVLRTPRRLVPWGGFEASLVLLLVLPQLLKIVLQALAPIGAANAADSTANNPVLQLLDKGRWDYVLIATAAAVFVAPLFEEFCFRLVLQGWLEKAVRCLPARSPRRRAWLRAIVPVVAVAALFALLHFRFAQPPAPLESLARGMLLYTLSCALIVAAGVAWLVLARGATAADLGVSRHALAKDVATGITAFLAFAPVLFPLQAILQWIACGRFAPDPIPIFFLAIVLGWLYHRTHRIVPGIAMHAALNATSTLIAVLAWLAQR